MAGGSATGDVVYLARVVGHMRRQTLISQVYWSGSQDLRTSKQYRLMHMAHFSSTVLDHQANLRRTLPSPHLPLGDGWSMATSMPPVDDEAAELSTSAVGERAATNSRPFRSLAEAPATPPPRPIEPRAAPPGPAC